MTAKLPSRKGPESWSAAAEHEPERAQAASTYTHTECIFSINIKIKDQRKRRAFPKCPGLKKLNSESHKELRLP